MSVHRLFTGLILVAAGGVASAQVINARLIGKWDGWTGEYADVWAEGNYAYLGHWHDANVDIVDISDPNNPTFVARYDLPTQFAAASAESLRIISGVAYIGMEGISNGTVHVADFRNPASPRPLTEIYISNFTGVHTMQYDNGYLYLADSATPRVCVVDVSTLDPNNPPQGITAAKWMVNNVGDSFVHDLSVKNGRLYAAAWDAGVQVYDVSDVANSAPKFLGAAPGNNTHSAWSTDDGAFVLTEEERSGGGIKVWRIVPSGSSVALQLCDQRRLPTTQSFCAHNPIIIGNRVYVGWYQAGAVVYDIDPLTGRLELAGRYDTFPGAVAMYDGAWGTFPFFGPDRLLVSDMETGLYVLEMAPLKFSVLGGVPQIMNRFGGGLFVNITPLSASAVVSPGSVTLHYDLGKGFVEVPFDALDADSFAAAFPAGDCGDLVRWYVSATVASGLTVNYPAEAPAKTFATRLAWSANVALAEDFENESGWTVVNENLLDGAWTRAVPTMQPGSTYDPGADFDGSGKCYVTDNAPNNDVDGGPTRLVSPALDLSAVANAEVSFARWVACSNGNDSLQVEISDDDAQSWKAVSAATDVSGGWELDSFLVTDFVAATDKVRVRFSIADPGNNSTTEAAIDRFQVSALSCAPACGADLDGDGKVCQGDLGLLLQAYGTCPGDAGYNNAVNIAAGACIEQADLGELLKNYGCGGCP